MRLTPALSGRSATSWLPNGKLPEESGVQCIHSSRLILASYGKGRVMDSDKQRDS